MLLYNMSIGMCLLSGSYFLLYKNGQSYRELAVLLLVCLAGIISGETWLVVSSITSQIYIALLPVLFFSLLLLVYWYHKSLILDKAWCFSSSCFKHLVPIAISVVLCLFILLMSEQEFQNLFFQEQADLSLLSEITAISFLVMTMFWLILGGVYLFKIISNTKTYHQNLKLAFANHENKKLNWLVVAIIWMIITWLYAALVLIFDNTLSSYYISDRGLSLCVLVLVWGLCVHMLQHQPALLGSNEEEAYKHSAVDDERLARIADKIELTIVSDELYLDSEVSASKLANKLGVSVHYLSQTFSQKMNTTFYDYINSARVNRAKAYLLETDKTVLDIATRVGFNTRSAFYNAFKKNTNMTPSQFRKQ